MNTDLQAANRRAAWRWGAFIVSLLGLQVIGGIAAVVLATSDESVAIVPDYHQKALKWDETIALRTASEALEWKCNVSQIDGTDKSHGLKLDLTDKSGNPIDVVQAELQIYRHARASDVRRVKIPGGPFRGFELEGCFDTEGRWQVTIDVTDRDGNRFAQSHELYVRSSGARISQQQRKGES